MLRRRRDDAAPCGRGCAAGVAAERQRAAINSREAGNLCCADRRAAQMAASEGCICLCTCSRLKQHVLLEQRIVEGALSRCWRARGGRPADETRLLA